MDSPNGIEKCTGFSVTSWKEYLKTTSISLQGCMGFLANVFLCLVN